MYNFWSITESFWSQKTDENFRGEKIRGRSKSSASCGYIMENTVNSILHATAVASKVNSSLLLIACKKVNTANLPASATPDVS